jgi:hypothetical protein
MKKIASLAVVALFTISTFAQEQHRQERKRGHQRSEFTVDQIAELQTKRMTLQLDLTQQQQEQILEINKTKVAEHKQKKEARKATKEADKAPTSDEVFKIQSERLDKMIAHKAEMKEILNSEQYDKWEKTSKRRAHHMKKKRTKQRKERRAKRK